MYESGAKGDGPGWRSECGSHRHSEAHKATRLEEITKVNKRSEN